MKEKALVTSFALAMTADTLVTSYALSHNLAQEINPLMNQFLESGESNEAIIAKVGVTAFMIGIYALSAKEGNRWKFTTEQALKISNMLMWGVFAWNMAQISIR